MIQPRDMEQYLGDDYAGKDILHGLAHIRRLLSDAREMGKKHPHDPDILMLAAYCHGVVYRKETELRTFFAGLGLPPDRIDCVIAAAWESQTDGVPKSIEGILLHDAHLLEGGRTFIIAKSLVTGAARGQTLEQTLDFIEQKVLGQFHCVLPEAQVLYADKEAYARSFVADLRQRLGMEGESIRVEGQLAQPGPITDFYDGLAPMYHLIYPDWEKSIARQAAILDALVRETWGPNVRTVLDVACGIGTQSIGLAGLGYQITASDISFREIERAKAETTKRGLSIAFSVADMREAFDHHAGMFDVVICCDNSLPHLLSDDDIRKALRQFYQCTAPGGGCLISVRDYEKEDLSGPQLRPYGTCKEHGRTWSLIQRWEPDGDHYDLTMYLIEDHGHETCATHVLRTRYYAIHISQLMGLMHEAGFQNVARVDDRFFQPVVVGTKPG